MSQPPHVNPDPDKVRDLLHEARCVAVVGLSPDPGRDSHKVAAYLLQHGFKVVPVNPKAESILGQRCFASLKDIPFPVDLVDVFRASEHTPPLAREAVEIGAKGLWLQLGVKSAEACAIASQGGLMVVQDKCLKIEHHRLAVPRR